MKQFLGRTLYLLLGLVAGGLIAGNMYSSKFDPMVFLQNANLLAANSYLMGCMEAKANSNTENKPFTYEVRYCKAKAAELFEKLETLRMDPGHK